MNPDEKSRAGSSPTLQDALLPPEVEDDTASTISAFSNENSISDNWGHDSDFSEHSFYIRNILSHLARISTSIRQSGSKDRHKRADDTLKDRIEEDDFKEFKAFLTLSILTSYLKADLQKGLSDDLISQTTSESRLSPVQKNLIQHNLLRRNRIVYATRHLHAEHKPVPEAPPVVQLQSAIPNVPPPQHRPAESKSTTAPSKKQVVPHDRPRSLGPSSISNSATAIGSQFNFQQVSTPSPPEAKTPSTITKVTRTGAMQDYPDCPPLMNNDTVQCPYCADILPKEYAKNKSKWRYVFI